MAAIKGRGNSSTELRFLTLLKKNKIFGWRRHYKVAGVRPDFIFQPSRVAVFLDGCYWHRCPEHYRPPKTNTEFWDKKIADNVDRDRQTDEVLRSKNWLVLRIWEHQLKREPEVALSELQQLLSENRY